MKSLVSIALVIFLLTSAVGVGVLTHDAHVSAHKLQEVAGQADTTLKRLDAYATFQLDEFQSDRYQKSVKATVDTGAYANSVMRSINVRVIPELITLLRKVGGTTDQSSVTLAALTDFVRDLNKRTAGDEGLLVAATRLIDSMNGLSAKFGVTVDELNTAITMAAEQAHKSLDAIYALISDPAIKSMLVHFDETSASTATLMAEIAKAGESAPGIAKSIEKISTESSRFARVTLIANILGTLARAFIP